MGGVKGLRRELLCVRDRIFCLCSKIILAFSFCAKGREITRI